MVTFAAIYMEPQGVLAWLAVGLVAGWLADRFVKGGGYGVIGDLVVGLLGALLGGVMFGLLWGSPGGLLGSTVVAFLGACLLIACYRAVPRERAGL